MSTAASSQLFPINLDKLTAKERHNYILNHYVLEKTAPDAESRKHKRDIDVIRENHRFLWNEEEAEAESLNWEQRLALRYYKKLFKEYCIADLTRYKENKIALRWRTEQEVVTGVGQFQCGSRHCVVREDAGGQLRSWEVNFKYIEQGVPQNVLVKLRLCPDHTEQLNYRTKKKEYKRQRRREKYERKSERKLKKRKIEPSNDVAEEQQEVETAPFTTTIEGNREAEAVDAEADSDEQIWRKQPDISQEQPSREKEFERYLEDLLL